MASAVLPSRNETYWGEPKVYMRNHPSTTTNGHSFLNLKPNQTLRPAHKPNRQNHDLSSNAHFRRREAPSSHPEPAFPNRKPVESKEVVHGRVVTFTLGAYSKRDLKELKRRLVSELEQVRALQTSLETLISDPRPVNPSTQFSATRTAPLHPNPVNPKKKNSGVGSKRSNPNSYGPEPSSKRPAMDPLMEKVVASMMKRCSQILAKIMKHKHAWVFSKPVDVDGMGLFDYNQIIKKPMDLGTVKKNLERNFYKTPVGFAADVKLTFDNAMTYNPKEHDVHIMAKMLLAKFEEMFNPAYKKFETEWAKLSGKIQGTLQPQLQPQPTLVKEIPLALVKEVPPALVNGSVKEVVVEKVEGEAVVEAPRVGRLPKPKAREPNKRAMTFEEKVKLGKDLEELPQEKMIQMMHIVKKRIGRLAQDGDEIELDMEVMDTETLWELDRFVNNHKKLVSKIKRQSMFNNQLVPPPIDQTPVTEMVDVAQKGGEEDVDIGEDIPIGNYPPVEIEKDVNVTGCASGRSRSSSSSGSSSCSDSSSSSDSDSGSSSGSDSDAGSVQSPYVKASEVGRVPSPNVKASEVSSVVQSPNVKASEVGSVQSPYVKASEVDVN